MEKDKPRKLLLPLLFFSLYIPIVIIILNLETPKKYTPSPGLRKHTNPCPFLTSKETITPLSGTKHLLVSAYMDQRIEGFDVRIIGIFRTDSIQPLYCLFCCKGELTTTTTKILQHSESFGFPFVTTDVLCQIPEHCKATHVSLVTKPDKVEESNPMWLPIRNQKGNEETKLQFNFTVCVSTLFGDYNNVLQFAQTLEMYRLLGVNRVVIYKNSCGPDLDRLLQSYSQEGFVEMVPWPIDQHLNPSHGWLFSKHGGDTHYFGQMTSLNECIYRSMERSRYVLLNDIDEIIMPYKHKDLMSLMKMLQQQQPNTGVFNIESHIFPKIYFEPNKTFHLPQWNTMPGINILEHIYREEPDRTVSHHHKMILQPRMVEQTSVHEVLKTFGPQYEVPPEVCRIIHVHSPRRTELKLEELNVDKRLWDFSDRLIPNVDKQLKKAGLLSSEEKG